jgi:predicted dithiol-disulfide oxidoreductase (DUF899 family)
MKLAEMELNREIVSETEWLVARRDLLTREKEFTRQRDALSAARREMPIVKIDKEYVFDGPNGKETLSDLFDGRSQLIVYHFMLGPGWEEGCKSCSYLADHFDGANWHLPQRDVTLVVVSRAPLSELTAYKKRTAGVSSGYRRTAMISILTITFPLQGREKKNKVYYNYVEGEFLSDELPGLSVFYKDDDGDIFHTYSTYARGLDPLVGAYNFLDLVPKGRDEDPDSTMSWVRRHDDYEA